MEPPIDDTRVCPCCGGDGYLLAHRQSDHEAKIAELERERDEAAAAGADAIVRAVRAEVERDAADARRCEVEAKLWDCENERDEARAKLSETTRVENWWLRDKQADEAALLRLSAWLRAHGQRDRDESCVGAAIAYMEELLRRSGDPRPPNPGTSVRYEGVVPYDPHAVMGTATNQTGSGPEVECERDKLKSLLRTIVAAGGPALQGPEVREAYDRARELLKGGA